MLGRGGSGSYLDGGALCDRLLWPAPAENACTRYYAKNGALS